MLLRNTSNVAVLASGERSFDGELSVFLASHGIDSLSVSRISEIDTDFCGNSTLVVPVAVLCDLDHEWSAPARSFDRTIVVAKASLLSSAAARFRDMPVVAWPVEAGRLAELIVGEADSPGASIPRWIVGQSPNFAAAMAKAVRFARFDVAVLIEGETGTGKDVMARAVHYHSARAAGPFMPINCGAMPDHLFESEMFGHAAGAFTDARSASPGLVGPASGGTLFLDEVDALSPHAQISMLRFLQDGSYRSVGSGVVRTADVRIIAAANRPLQDVVAAGGFREDLLFRLNMATIALPALRERPADILPLARHFLHAACERYGARHKTFSPEMLAWLVRQPWPGNIRQLQNAVERGFMLADGDVIAPPGGDTVPDLESVSEVQPEVPFADAKARVVAAFEKDYLTQLLARQHGNVSQAARAAHKERKAFNRLLKKHGIQRVDFARQGAADAATEPGDPLRPG